MTELERAARDWLEDKDVQELPKHLPDELVQHPVVEYHQAEFWAFVAGAKWALDRAAKEADKVCESCAYSGRSSKAIRALAGEGEK